MPNVDKNTLSERDICTKIITPSIIQAGWLQSSFREEVKLTAGRVIVRGKVAARIKDPTHAKVWTKASRLRTLRAHKCCVGRAKKRSETRLSLSHGMQQALAYAEMLDAPFAISSNGDGFLIHVYWHWHHVTRRA